MTEPDVPNGLADPAAVQAAIRRDRDRLLAGRGPGASSAEIDRLTRGRPQMAGEPTPQYLATVARQTAIARGDAASMALDIAATRGRLAGDFQAIRERVSPKQTADWTVRVLRRRAGGGGSAVVVAVVGAVLAATVVVILRRSRRVSGSGRAKRP